MNDEKQIDAICQMVGSEMPKAAPGVVGAPGDRLRAILKWLRDNNVPWLQIIVALPTILAAISAGDWAAAIQILIKLFNLDPSTTGPVVV